MFCFIAPKDEKFVAHPSSKTSVKARCRHCARRKSNTYPQAMVEKCDKTETLSCLVIPKFVTFMMILQVL